MRRGSQAGRKKTLESLSITVMYLNPQPRITGSNGESRRESLSGKGQETSFLSLRTGAGGLLPTRGGH